jgi:HEAT repeat protein
LAFAILASFAMIALMLVVTIGVKAFHAMRRAWYASNYRSIEPELEKYVSTGEPQPALERLRPWQRERFLSHLMIERIALLKGAEKERMLQLAADMGLVERYLGYLTLRRRWHRAKAAENLGYFGGPRVASAVSALLSDGDETVRAVAARALARIGTDEAVRALARTLDAPSELTRLRVAENLERIGIPSIGPLVEALDAASRTTTDPYGAIMAARVLGHLRAAQARDALLRTLAAHENDELRAEAAQALGLIGVPDDVPDLLNASFDRAWIVRAQVASALGMIGEISVIQRLKELASDEAWWVRRNACSALANMGPKGEETLVELLKDGDRNAHDQVAATLETRGFIRRAVRNLTKPGKRGERARGTVAALVEAGTTKYLEGLAASLPEGEERSLLNSLLAAHVPSGMENPRAGASGAADELGLEGR